MPQGTVLGPLLFLAFINDLPHHVQSQIRLFAGDCLLYRPICDVSDSVALQSSVGFLPGRKVFLPHEGEKQGRNYFCHSFCHFCRGEMAEIIKT